jgi:L-serine dehydratase
MTTSVFDLFKRGVGPSSSHTMGPMTAAGRFVGLLATRGLSARVARVETTLQGSLALTGRGHATDRAVILGLAGFAPASLDPDEGEAALTAIRAAAWLVLGPGGPGIAFEERRDILWLGGERALRHPNAMTFAAFDAAGAVLLRRDYFSIGGGFVRDQDEIDRNAADDPGPAPPHPFVSGLDLLARAEAAGLTIAELMFANETALRTPEAVSEGLEAIHAAMEACIERGMRQEGRLPGGLEVKRRARQLRTSILARMELQIVDPLAAMAG